MSSTSLPQQYLSSAEMRMLARVLKKVSAFNSMPEDSRNARRATALLIKEFPEWLKQ